MSYIDTKIGIEGNHNNGEDNWDIAYNSNLEILRFISLMEIQGIANDESSPLDSDFYIVGDTPAGAYVGASSGDLAFYRTDTWIFLTPPNNLIKYNSVTGSYLRFNGTLWVDFLTHSETILGTTTTGTVTLNLALGRNFITNGATGNITLAFSNVPAIGLFKVSYTFIQDATGSRTLSFPASVEWAGGTAPTVTAAANSEDEFSFITRDGGTTWKGQVVGQNYS